MQTGTTTRARERSPTLDDRRRYVQAFGIGAVVATVVVVVALLGGRPSLLQHTWRGDFYDLQARSLLHLRWDVPARSIGGEGFVVHGKTYMYFGVFPALLRLPFVAVTHALDGRLTQLSMLAAWLLVLLAVGRLAWQVRRIVSRDRPLDRVEMVAVASFVALVGVGTPVLYLVTRPFVYHEAVIWGLAWALLAVAAVLRYSSTRRREQLLLAGAFTTGALLSRAPLGATALLTILFLAFAAGVPRRWRAALALDDLRLDGRDAVGLGATGLAAIVPYLAVNFARFGTLFSVPWASQIEEYLNHARLHNLELNGGTPFGLKYLPTTLLQYLRPDAIAFHWMPTYGAHTQVLFGVKLDGDTPSSSIVDSMLVFSVLALVGVVWLVRRQTGPRGARGQHGKHLLAIPVVAMSFGTLSTFSYGYIAHRYLVDFMPLVVLLALVGLNATLDALRRWSPERRQVACIALGALALVNVWVSVGLAKDSDRSRHQHDDPCYRALAAHVAHPHLSC